MASLNRLERPVAEIHFGRVGHHLTNVAYGGPDNKTLYSHTSE